MTSAKGNSRGLREIRTHSGKVDRVAIPHMAYMNISCLEMEKARREKEKFIALNRIKDIEKRLQEIEAEKDLLLKRLGERCHNGPQGVPIFKAPTVQSKPGFKIKY
ncbi:MAG: hypothetical protein HY912_20120 [Desulfomonile tiedjei]|uniref:Uncharacterized protein n=1 Tax=Desulfomonile tiedjei TaxID=2358 RepID=A0A9D6Z876_9BACT|nr:hypothetical protein [Desulfomonile tiedjei]